MRDIDPDLRVLAVGTLLNLSTTFPYALFVFLHYILCIYFSFCMCVVVQWTQVCARLHEWSNYFPPFKL